MREGERLEKLWEDEKIWEGKKLEKCKCEILKKKILKIIIRKLKEKR